MKQNLKEKVLLLYSAQNNKASLIEKKVTFFLYKGKDYVCFSWESIAHTDNFDFSSQITWWDNFLGEKKVEVF